MSSTIGKGIVDPAIIDQQVVFAALVGAIAWDIITWYYGIPSSSSHALVGGLTGAALVKGGVGSLVAEGITRTAVFIVLSPLIGFVVALVLVVAVTWVFHKRAPGQVVRLFGRLQLLSAAFYSLGHGTNDAQKTMGIITVLLFSSGYLGEQFYVPRWVILSAHAAIALGTLAGGWRIVRTMGMRLTKLETFQGFCAETAGALALLGTALIGIPVSTTHTIAGAIMGVGSVRRLSAVRWGVAGNMVVAWILTIPCSGLMAAGTWWLVGGLRALIPA